MKKYDYYEAMKDDIKTYIIENYSGETFNAMLDNIDDCHEELNDLLWVEDSVTGNASGSYTFNRYTAEEYLCHNMDLLAEALEEFCCTVDVLEKGAEWCDVTIRCYLLSSVLWEVLEEMASKR